MELRERTRAMYRKPPRFQFGLKALLGAVTVVCVLSALMVRFPQLFADITCGVAATLVFVLLAWVGAQMERVSPFGYLGPLIASISIVLAIFCGLVTLLLAVVVALRIVGLA